MKQISVVYRIVCSVNGKSYVGSSWRKTERWKRHLTDLKFNRHHSSKMQKDFNEYGKNSFAIEVIKEFDCVKECKEYETEMVTQYDTYQNGYNMGPTGHNGTMSTATLRKLKELWNTPEKKEYCRLRALKQFSKKSVRKETSQRQLDFIAREPEKAFAICSAAGKAAGPKNREMRRKPVIRSDGKKYEAIIDAGRDMNPEFPERGRACIRQALKRGNESMNYFWTYSEK